MKQLSKTTAEMNDIDKDNQSTTAENYEKDPSLSFQECQNQMPEVD